MSRYDNDKLYADYSYEDETSQFDPLGTWQGGGEYYSRTFNCRVPRRMLEKAKEASNYDAVNSWLENNEHKPGIWR